MSFFGSLEHAVHAVTHDVAQYLMGSHDSQKPRPQEFRPTTPAGGFIGTQPSQHSMAWGVTPQKDWSSIMELQKQAASHATGPTIPTVYPQSGFFNDLHRDLYNTFWTVLYHLIGRPSQVLDESK